MQGAGFSGQSVILKKSPIVIAKQFIALQSAAVLAFFGLSSLAYYARIYRSLPIAHAVSFRIAETLFLLAVEACLVFWIFLRWYREYLIISSDRLVHGRGVIYHRTAVIPLASVSSVTSRQSPLGKLTNYGTLECLDAASRRVFAFSSVPDPRAVAERVLVLLSRRTSVSLPAGGLKMLLHQNEDEHLEFKSSFRWDFGTNRVNKALEKSVMKTIAGFLNSRGGQLVIGVDDARTVLGVSHDCVTLARRDADGFENHFSNVFHAAIGNRFRHAVSVSWHTLDGKECCLVSVMPASAPAYVRTDTGEEFYIRTGNGTTSLSFSEAAAYIAERFRA